MGEKKFTAFDFEKHSAGEGSQHSFSAMLAPLATLCAKAWTREFRVAFTGQLTREQALSFAEWQSHYTDQFVHLVLVDKKSKLAFVVSFDRLFIGQAINLSSGGKSNLAAPVNLPMTKISEKIIRGLGETVCTHLESILAPANQPQFVIKNSEAKAGLLNMFPDQERVIKISYELLSEGLSTALHFHLLLPLAWYRKNKSSMSSQPISKAENSWVSQLTKHVKRVALQVRVELGVAELTVDELMQLGPGDVIVLDRFANDPLPVFVENQLKFYGLPGVSRGHRALRIKSSV
jgi:flagellar motor switch protein FliM